MHTSEWSDNNKRAGYARSCTPWTVSRRVCSKQYFEIHIKQWRGESGEVEAVKSYNHFTFWYCHTGVLWACANSFFLSDQRSSIVQSQLRGLTIIHFCQIALIRIFGMAPAPSVSKVSHEKRWVKSQPYAGIILIYLHRQFIGPKRCILQFL